MKILKQFNWRRCALIVAVLAVIGGADQVARANGGFDWTQWVSNGATVQFDVRVWEDGGDPGPGDDINIIDVTSTRGPIVGGTCSIDAVVTSTRPDLVQIRLMEADDLNLNGTIDAGEWIVLGTALATPDGNGGTIATIAPQTASAGRAAHRVEQTFTWGVTFDEIRDFNLN